MNFENHNLKIKILDSLRMNPSADRIEFYYPAEMKKVVIFDKKDSKNDFESDVIDFLANASLTYTIRDFRYSSVDFHYIERPIFSFFLEYSVIDTNIDCETIEAFIENIRRMD